MGDKKEFSIDELRMPECIECFSRITNHANGVFGTFEVQSNELFQDFHKKAADSLAETAKKTDRTVQEHFRKQEMKEDAAMSEHFEKQSVKYDNFEKKVLGLIWKVLGFIMGIILLCSGIVGYTWITVQNKADDDKVFLLEEAKQLEKLRASYMDSRYVINPNQTIDSYNYQWLVESIFEHNLRGGGKTVPLKMKNDTN
jgi:hypothetical protein